jgi:CMP-N,N'-diacetyllegionaminic acid synthase
MKLEKFNFLGIIPARSGNQEINNKNIIKLKNKLLIEFTLISAKKSKLLNDVIVSTNSKKIKELAIKHKIDCPFLRPDNLATKFSHISETLFYTLKKYETISKKKFDYVVMLQPTSPKREPGEIDRCIKKIIKYRANSLISLVKMDEPHPMKLKKINKNFVSPFIKGVKDNLPRQKLEKVYAPSGNVYIFSRKLILKKKLSSKDMLYDLIKINNYLNINNHIDIIRANSIL